MIIIPRDEKRIFDYFSCELRVFYPVIFSDYIVFILSAVQIPHLFRSGYDCVTKVTAFIRYNLPRYISGDYLHAYELRLFFRLRLDPNLYNRSLLL